MTSTSPTEPPTTPPPPPKKTGRRGRPFATLTARVAENDMKYTSLLFYNLRPTMEEVVELLQAAASNHVIDTVSFSSMKVTEEIAEAMAIFLERSTSICTFRLLNNHLSTISIARICGVSSRVQELVIDSQPLDEAGCMCLSSLLSLQNLKRLSLWGNRITDVPANAIGKALNSSHTLELLRLSSNQITSVGVTQLATTLASHPSLTELHIPNNTIGDEGCALIANALSTNNVLKLLDISSNSITAIGAASFSHALVTNTSLVKLIIGYNEIGDNGAAAIAQGLLHNNSLLELDLKQCRDIGDMGASALAGMLINNQALRSLDLEFNIIAEEGAEALAHALEKNIGLEALDLGFNQLGDRGVRAIATALKTNHTLSKLALHRNSNISELGEEALVNMLPINVGLISLEYFFTTQPCSRKAELLLNPQVVLMRIPWRESNHHLRPQAFRNELFTIMMCYRYSNSPLLRIVPFELMALIFEFLAAMHCPMVPNISATLKRTLEDESPVDEPDPKRARS